MINSASHDSVSRLVADRPMCLATALDKAFENIDCMSAILRCQAKNRFYESTQRLIQPRRVLWLPAFILMLYSTAQPRDVLLAIPVNIVELSDETTGPPQPDKALVPQQRAAEPSSPVAEPVGISRLTKPPLPDALETKLRMLAKLQQPVVDTHLLEKEVGRSRISAMRDEALP